MGRSPDKPVNSAKFAAGSFVAVNIKGQGIVGGQWHQQLGSVGHPPLVGRVGLGDGNS